MNWLARPQPSCMLFPRSINNLFDYQANQRGTILGPVRYKDLFPSFLNHDDGAIPDIVNYETGKKDIKLKQIDTRVYLDLWRQKEGEGEQVITETRKKISIAVLKNEGDDKYSIYDRYDKEKCLESTIDAISIKVDAKSSGKKIYINAVVNGTEYTNKNDTTNPLVIPASCFNKNYCLEVEICIPDSTRNVPSESAGKIEVQAQLIIKGKSGNIVKMALELYRHRESMNGTEKEPLAKFKKKSGKDHDVFIFPRVNQEKAHELIINRLQVINNQVIARHAGISNTQFKYVDEDGKYSEQLGINIQNCIPVFKKTKTGQEKSNLKTVFPYTFTNFGLAKDLALRLSQEYGLDEHETERIIIDRNLLYGLTDNPGQLAQVEGLESLYTRVVEVFRRRFVTRSEDYLKFNKIWLSRPRFNEKYQRGTLTIPASANVSLYTQESGGSPIQNSTLAEGSKVEFYQGKDMYDAESVWRYKIRSIQNPSGQTQTYPENGNGSRYIPLTRELRALCEDREKPVNKCNYVETDGLNAQDAAGVQQYAQYNGVPYYISTMDQPGNTGGKQRLAVFTDMLPSTIPESWYAYGDGAKPNSPKDPVGQNYKGIGLDCSGLVMNCFLETTASDTVTKYFETNQDIQQNAYDLGTTRTREYEVEKLTLIQSGDILYSQFVDSATQNTIRHVMICAIDAESTLSEADINSRYFTIIHNYGNEYINVDLPTPLNKYHKGFFCKTLKGPFRHCGLRLTANGASARNTWAGRVYLWYPAK